MSGDGGGGASLGRFLPDGGVDGEPSTTVDVHLVGMPVLVMRAAREHHDGLMREFRLLALSGGATDDDVPVRLADLTRILGDRYGTTRERRDAELDAAIAAGALTVDQVETVPVAAGAAAAGLAALLAEADAYCRDAVLMTLPRPPLLQRFGDWYTRQFVDQTAGRPPVPWDGPLRAED
ncbi:hypothetical protein [Aquipuribacter hungaricus]|uniref:Uncharacterized protein n=1 Tax=Aquipuribacter hungaricus TaxID=545624 RepID=A0ABV7WJH0_9MICO